MSNKKVDVLLVGAGVMNATQVKHGTDIDFGFLARKLVKALLKLPNFELKLSHTIMRMKQYDDGRWQVRVKDNHSNRTGTVDAGFVFLGAGGGALSLLKNVSSIRRFHRLTQIFSRLLMCSFSPDRWVGSSILLFLIGENLRNLRAFRA